MLKIAFITYEFPPDIGQGGIATYIGQISKAMQRLGHHVEIFSGSRTRECSERFNGILTHRILSKSPVEFNKNVVLKFIERHEIVEFDVFECAEINADGSLIKEQLPDLPLVVKLHAPTYLLIRLLNYHTPIITKLRFFLGNLRKGVWRPWGKPDLARDKDYLFSLKADRVISPSASLKGIIVRDWRLPEDQIEVIPNPYEPTQEMLSIPIKVEANKELINVLFIGRLNIQKGVLLLADVIPKILKANHNVKFTFVGGDGPSQLKGTSMRSHLQQKLSNCSNSKSVEFAGAVSLEEVPKYLEKADIVVIPSLWENFPYVCLEAMSAGKAVIGSNCGGMSEILGNGAGVLINPLSSRQLTKAIELLIDKPELRYSLGMKGRTTVLENYNFSRIGCVMQHLYSDVILKKHKLNNCA